VRALAAVSGVEAKVISHRLMGDWPPTEQSWARVMQPGETALDRAHPYPFFLAHPLEGAPEALGPREDWFAEWKWDGIRAQLIRRGDAIALWSRGDESIAGQFPEIMADAPKLPDCVIDGEILAWKDGRVMPFAALQKRLGRKNPGRKVMTESPVIFLAFDLLEFAGVGLARAASRGAPREAARDRPLHPRRLALRHLRPGARAIRGRRSRSRARRAARRAPRA
jgi:DNA ligase-1